MTVKYLRGGRCEAWLTLVMALLLVRCGAPTRGTGTVGTGTGGGGSSGAGATATGGSSPLSGGGSGTNVGGSANSGGGVGASGGGATSTAGNGIGGNSSSGTSGVAGSLAVGGSGATAGAEASGGTMSVGGAVGTSLGAIYSGVPWLDTNGNLVNAHGPGFIKVDNTYYMVGEARSGANDSYTGAIINGEDTFTGISMYSTTDFVSWTFVGTVVTPISGTILAPPNYGERPKILYNASTSKYVIYVKMLTYVGSPPVYTGHYAVLTSSNITGPYSYHGNLSPSNAGDFQVFQDTDGAQYLARDGGTLYKFSADGLTIASTAATNIQSGEGTSLYKAGNTYFWQSSQGTYWYSNDNSYSTATSLAGPWTARGHFCPTGSKTWQSQDTAVVAVTGSAGTTYIYVGDRWTNGDLPSSTLVVQPLNVSGSTESIPNYTPIWNLNVNAGTWSPVTPSGTSVDDNVTGTAANQFNYSNGWAAGTSNGAYDNGLHSSSTSGASATIGFTGTQILLYSAYDSSSGIMGVTIGDSSGTPLKAEVRVSLRYDAPAAGNYLVYASPVLPNGAYQLKVRVTGRKDLYSSGTSCNIDRVLIQGGT